MSEFLPREVREGLEIARRLAQRRKSRLRLHLGNEIYPVLRLWHEGLALEAGHLTHLRGLGDIYDGSRHMWQCLIVASDVENGELICTFKRSTLAEDKAPLDFVRAENAPVGLLPRF